MAHGSGKNEMFSDNKIGGKKASNSGFNSYIPIGTGLVSVLPPSPTPRPDLKRSGGVQKRKVVTMDKSHEEKTLEVAGSGEGQLGRDDIHDQLHVWTERERRKRMKDMFTNLHALLPQLSPKADKATIVDEAVTYIQRLEQIYQNFERKKVERIQYGMQGYNSALNHKYDISQQQQQQQQNFIAEETREAFMADHYVSNSSVVHYSNDHVLSSNSLLPPAFWTWTSPNVVLSVFGEQAQFSVCALKKPGLFYGICFFLQKHSLQLLYCSILTDHSSSMYTIHAQLMKGTSCCTPGDDHLIPQAGFPVEQVYKRVAVEINFWVTS